MTFAYVDRLGDRSVEAAVRALTASHSDRAIVLAEHWDNHAIARILPALPPGAFRDPDLAGAGRDLFECPVRLLPLVHAWRPADAGEPARMVCASHSWAALAFSRAVRAGYPPARLLHIDAHDDLARPPRGRRIEIGEPARVAACVAQGRLGIGSFIDPFLLAGAVTEVHHFNRDLLSEPPPDPFAGPVWLDIDLDVLCNSLDDRTPEPAVDSRQVSKRLETLGTFLEAVLPRPPQLLTVALSPGFFPSAHWRQGLSGLKETLTWFWPKLRLPFLPR